MEIAAFVFGIFGLMAFVQLSSLQARVKKLESELGRMEGTSFVEERKSLAKAVKEYYGLPVNINFKEDESDVDIVMYGNSKHGHNIIMDSDDEWMQVKVVGPKAVKTKLIRLDSVSGVDVK